MTTTEQEQQPNPLQPARKRRPRRGRRDGRRRKAEGQQVQSGVSEPPAERTASGTDFAEPIEPPLPFYEEEAPAVEPPFDASSRALPEAINGSPPGPAGAEGQPGRPRRRRRRSSRGRHRHGRSGEAPATNGDGHEVEVAASPAPAPAVSSAAERIRPPQARPAPEEIPSSSDDEGPPVTADRTMLINVAEDEECRIAILQHNRLEELFIERASAESHVGNIYKGRITNVEPSIQAAFIDFGLPKNGFLHISDLQPQYFPDGRGQPEEVGRKTPRRDRPPIQRCLRRGQEIIVQIIKEGIGTKGPTLTTYISIPGRYLVMMPGMNRLGVSRKIEDEDERRKMRRILDELELPKDMGFILRTAGLDKTKRDLQRDLTYLQRLWKRVAMRIKSDRAPCELYQESDLVIRTIRDVYSSDFKKLIVDNQVTADKVRDFLAIAMPRSSAPVELYTSHEPLFHTYGIEAEIERINARHVPLGSGGYLVIESTEAMVTIDVNSGRYRDLEDAEQTAYRINLEAAEEIARQLRLRDLGGLILCDFIDMHQEKHRRGVERALREALRKHKERAKCLRMSLFGIIEMTRQRMRPSIKRSIYQDCPNCRGSGLVKNPESMSLDVMRLLRVATHHPQVEMVEVRVAPAVAFQLQNRKRAVLYSLEQTTSRRVVIRPDGNLGLDQYVFECFDRRGGAIRVIDKPEEPVGLTGRPIKRPEQAEPARTFGENDINMFE